jgi:hypothetical protein
MNLKLENASGFQTGILPAAKELDIENRRISK